MLDVNHPSSERLQKLRLRLLELDTAAVSDALDSLGISRALPGIKQRVSGHKIAGPAYTVQYGPISASRSGFQNAGNYIDDIPRGHVAVVSNNGNTDCTNWGDILTTMAVGKGLGGTLIDGSARDISYIRQIGYPLFSRDTFMVSAKNRAELKAKQCPVTIGGTLVENGDWIFGDENGVVVIADDQIEEVVRRAENVNKTEDRILSAISSGMDLSEARKKFGYATPWEAQPEPDAAAQTFEAYWAERLDFMDIHYHANPDTYTRRYAAHRAGEIYKDLRGAVVLKSHLGDTTTAASCCRDQALPVFGSTGLNAIAGGVSMAGIARALAVHQTHDHAGRLIVDLPTVVQTDHVPLVKRAYANTIAARFSQAVEPIFDANNRLTAKVLNLLDFCAEQSVVISSGHANKAELYALVEACSARPGIRLLLNQPANPITGMSAQALVDLGHHDWLYIEQTALTYLLGYQDDADFHAVLNDVPNLIYSSDLGQSANMSPPEWRAKSTSWFAASGLSPERISQITLTHPLQMLAP